MEVSVKLHVSAAFLLRMRPPVPFGKEVWWAQELESREKFLLPAVQPVTRRNID
jgi:hypothetical protein